MPKHDGPLFALVEVHAGRLRLPSADRLAAQLRQLRDGDYELVLERKQATRSYQANRYYFGVVLKCLSEHTGYHVDELHEHFKLEFLPKPIALAAETGEIVSECVIGGSTRKLNGGQFTEYVERIRQVAAEMGVYIPDPNEVSSVSA